MPPSRWSRSKPSSRRGEIPGPSARGASSRFTQGGVTVRAHHDLLDGIDLIVFDKDGTLIEFHVMWGGWVTDLSDRLEAETGLALHDGLFDLLGVDRATGVVQWHGLLAATAMARIREAVEDHVAHAGAGAAARAALRAAWHPPDPVALARPVTDLRRLLASLRPRVPRFAVATSDDRGPTERTLASLGIAGEFATLACADDGHAGKPAPDPVLRICQRLHVEPARVAVVGDSPADMQMGRAAGVGRLIGVLTGVGDEAALAPLADTVLPSIEDLAPA